MQLDAAPGVCLKTNVWIEMWYMLEAVSKPQQWGRNVSLLRRNQREMRHERVRFSDRIRAAAKQACVRTADKLARQAEPTHKGSCTECMHARPSTQTSFHASCPTLYTTTQLLTSISSAIQLPVSSESCANTYFQNNTGEDSFLHKNCVSTQKGHTTLRTYWFRNNDC